MRRNRVIALLPVVLCGASIVVAASGSTPASASSAANARTAKKECNVKFVVKGTAGETRADLFYGYETDNGGANKQPKNVKLPWSVSTGNRLCDYGVAANLSADNHSDGRGDTYVYLYVNGHLVGDGFGSGDASSASANYSVFSY